MGRAWAWLECMELVGGRVESSALPRPLWGPLSSLILKPA